MRTLILCLLSIFFVNNVHAWQIQDPKNDDRGVGTVVYPTSNMYKKGELDITEVGLETANDGYWMNIKFAKPIQAPKKQVDPISGEPLDNFYRHKFFNFLVDIYIKSDKGFQTTLPGRRVLLPEAEGWSKAIVLSPKPKGERQLFIEKAVVDLENIERDNNKSIDDKVLESLKQQAIEKVDALVYYPNKIQVFQKTVKFFIPQTFATEEQLKAENLHIMVMANNLRLRASQVWSDREQGSYVLPGKIGYPIDFVGFDARSDPLQPPVFDYVGTPQKQTSILSQFIIRQEGFSFIDYDNRNKQYNREKSTINESKKALTSSKVKEKPTLIPVKKEKISIEQRLIQLKDLYTKGLISEAEFQQLRSKILNEL